MYAVLGTHVRNVWMNDEWTDVCVDGSERGAVYSLGLVMPDPSLSVLLVRPLADLTVNGTKRTKGHK